MHLIPSSSVRSERTVNLSQFLSVDVSMDVYPLSHVSYVGLGFSIPVFLWTNGVFFRLVEAAVWNYPSAKIQLMIFLSYRSSLRLLLSFCMFSRSFNPITDTCKQLDGQDPIREDKGMPFSLCQWQGLHESYLLAHESTESFRLCNRRRLRFVYTEPSNLPSIRVQRTYRSHTRHSRI